MKRFLLFLLIIITNNFCYGDSPPSWEPYKIASRNKDFFCWIDFNDNDTSNYRWNRKWLLKVYDKDSILIWQKEYQPSGYSNGILSNDGEKFVYIEYWYYHDEIAVEITSKNNPDIYIKTSDFHISENSLVETVSHKIWLKHCLLDDNKLIILTLEGKTWIIDIETGRMELSKRGFYQLSKEANSIAVSFLIFAAVIIVFIIIMFFWMVKLRDKNVFLRKNKKSHRKAEPLL